MRSPDTASYNITLYNIAGFYPPIEAPLWPDEGVDAPP